MSLQTRWPESRCARIESKYRSPTLECVGPGVGGLCVLVTLTSWFGSTEDVRDSAQRDSRNLCPLLRMISLRRQGPGERMDQRPRWMSKIGHERLSSGTENPICRNRVLCASHSVPIPPCTCGCRLTTWRQSGHGGDLARETTRPAPQHALYYRR